jgi:hypothetical protein
LIDENGDESFIASNETNDILKIKSRDELYVGRENVAAGKYLIGFTATDFAENISEKYVEATIE